MPSIRRLLRCLSHSVFPRGRTVPSVASSRQVTPFFHSPPPHNATPHTAESYPLPHISLGVPMPFNLSSTSIFCPSSPSASLEDARVQHCSDPACELKKFADMLNSCSGTNDLRLDSTLWGGAHNRMVYLECLGRLDIALANYIWRSTRLIYLRLDCCAFFHQEVGPCSEYTLPCTLSALSTFAKNLDILILAWERVNLEAVGTYLMRGFVRRSSSTPSLVSRVRRSG
ncbi:hypothetical protein OF83DRAFT_345295 [Amylostereum chailletii]|nr:hypothetical protein OF83DRAFT_345295 [Amylostereum chailletii]